MIKDRKSNRRIVLKNKLKQDIKEKSSGITLIALVVTIVVLLILAGITIQLVFSDGGIFNQANRAKEQTEIAEIKDRLGLIEAGLKIKKLTQGKITSEDYFQELKNQGMITDTKVGGDNIKEIEPDENGNPTYEITLEDGSVIEVVITPEGDITTEYKGKDKDLPPRIEEIIVKNKTTNSISIEVKVKRLDNGKLSYYYQEQETTNLQKLTENTSDLTAEYTGLKQNVIYNLKVVVENKKGTDEKSINVLTGSLPTGVIKQKGETRWENETAIIELETTTELEQGVELQYQVNEREWKKYSGSITNLHHGDIVFVRIYDGVNESIEESSFIVLDNEKPNEAIIKLDGNNTTTIASLTATVTLSDNKSGINFEKCKWVYNDNPEKLGEEESDIFKYSGGSISSNEQKIELAKQEKGQYYLHILSTDKAGNRKETVSEVITVTQLAEGISLNQTTATVNMGSTLQLIATVTPESTDNKGVTWTSSNPNVATVNEVGVITPIAVGTTTITVTTNDGSNKTDTCDVTVRQLATGISLNQTVATVNMGSTLQLTATVTPDTTSNKEVTWTSSNPNVATVDGAGVITPIAVGTTTITVTTNDGTNQSATCDVTVRQLATGISLNQTTATVNIGSTLQLVATVTPDTTSNKGVTWTSSNPNVATVNAVGVITPIAVGTATITVTTNDGTNRSATCNVTVRQLATGISLNQTTATVNMGSALQLVATVTPDTTSNKGVTWTSSNQNVATVDGAGFITPRAVGTTYITATTNDGTNRSATCSVTVRQLATGISLNQTTATLNMGNTLQLVATVTPDTTSNKGVTWASSNPNVATVNAAGVVIPAGSGTTNIIATTTDGSNRSATCSVTVNQLATGISLNTTSAPLRSGEVLSLTANVTPDTTSNKGVIWTSSDTNVATVNSAGVVTVKSMGYATITATTADGSNRSATCSITPAWTFSAQEYDVFGYLRENASTSNPTEMRFGNSARQNLSLTLSYHKTIPAGAKIEMIWKADRGSTQYYLETNFYGDVKYVTTGMYGNGIATPGTTYRWTHTTPHDINPFTISINRSDCPGTGYWMNFYIYGIYVNGQSIL